MYLKTLRKYTYIVTATLLLAGCNSNKSKPTESSTTEETKTAISPEQKLATHWDGIALQDSSLSKETLEQALADYIAIFPYVDDAKRADIVTKFLSKLKQHSGNYDYIMQQFDHYLYNPNSPVRNDLYYEPIVSFAIDSTQLNEADLFRYQSKLKLLKKNKVGEIAEDFSFLTAKGTELRLADIKGSFILLFFYEPGCSHCEKSLADFRSVQGFEELINQKIVQAVAVYPFGDNKAWKGYQDKIPTNWINGYDQKQAVVYKELYDLKATPTIYLLNKDKRVLLKDTDVLGVISFFNKNGH